MSQAAFLTGLVNAVYRDSRFRRADFDRLLRRKLVRLLSWAKDHVEFQKARLADVNLHAPDMNRIRPTTKSELMQCFDETIADRAFSWNDIESLEQNTNADMPILNGKYLVSRTSGTNGEAGCFVHDMTAWSRLRAVSLTRTMRGRLSPLNLARFSFGRRCRMAFIITDCRYSTSRHAGFSPMKLGKLYTDVRLFPIATPLNELIESLNRFQPHYVHSYPTVFESIARRKLDGSAVEFTPELLSFSSEALLPGAAATIREAFPQSIQRSIYATTECLPLAHACEQGSLHWNMDSCLLEPVSANSAPTPPGEFSDHVLITNLENLCQPLIRYRLDDSIRMVPEPCPCGRPLPVIEVQGRSDDRFVFADESGHEVVVPPIPVTLPLHKVDGLVQFQIVQESLSCLKILCVRRRDADAEELKSEIDRTLRTDLTAFGHFPLLDIVVQFVDSFERKGSGRKLRQCISHVTQTGSVI